MLIIIIAIFLDLVVVGTGHHHVDGEIALRGETHAKAEVTIGTHVITQE